MQAISSPRSLDFEEIKSIVIGKQALLSYFQKRNRLHQKPFDDKIRDQTLKFAGGSIRIWSKNSASNFRLTFFPRALHREEVKFILSETAPADITEVAVRSHNNNTEALTLDQYLSLSTANKQSRANIPHKGSSIIQNQNTSNTNNSNAESESRLANLEFQLDASSSNTQSRLGLIEDQISVLSQQLEALTLAVKNSLEVKGDSKGSSFGLVSTNNCDMMQGSGC